MVDESGSGAVTALASAGGPSAEEALGWVGHQLDDLDGVPVGKVDGVLVDAESRQPEWLIVRAGRFAHRTLVPGRHAVAAAGRVWMPYARDAVRGAPRVDGSRGLTRADEDELLAHYGVGGGAGRAAEISGREPSAVTATPAT
jgi:hypothetical protein